jgi:hypothetical protein
MPPLPCRLWVPCIGSASGTRIDPCSFSLVQQHSLYYMSNVTYNHLFWDMS